MFQDYIYENMLQNEETWYIFGYNHAFLMSDASLIDN